MSGAGDLKLPSLPQLHTAVFGIRDAADGESIATAAANAALSLLARVSAEQRAAVEIDRVTIVRPEAFAGTAASLLGASLERAAGVVAGYAVVVSVRVIPPKPEPEPDPVPAAESAR